MKHLHSPYKRLLYRSEFAEALNKFTICVTCAMDCFAASYLGDLMKKCPKFGLRKRLFKKF